MTESEDLHNDEGHLGLQWTPSLVVSKGVYPCLSRRIQVGMGKLSGRKDPWSASHLLWSPSQSSISRLETELSYWSESFYVARSLRYSCRVYLNLPPWGARYSVIHKYSPRKWCISLLINTTILTALLLVWAHSLWVRRQAPQSGSNRSD
jgi:hypothetical protein